MRPLWLLPSLLCVALAGCGASTETFAEQGFEITFDYPAEMELGEVTGKQSFGAQADETVALAFDEDAFIAVQRADLDDEVTEENVDGVKADVDGLVFQLDPAAGSGKDISLDGFEAFEYYVEPARSPLTLKYLAPGAPPAPRSRYVVLFEGDTQYVINCQATEERREEISGACATVLDTVRPAGG